MHVYTGKKSSSKSTKSNESGVSFLETLIALAVLGAIAVTFLTGIATSTKAAFISDQQATAQSLAQNQMEWVKNAEYEYDDPQYSAPLPDSVDYADFSVEIAAEPLRSPDDGIQKITVIVRYSGKGITTLESYKVDR